MSKVWEEGDERECVARISLHAHHPFSAFTAIAYLGHAEEAKVDPTREEAEEGKPEGSISP